MSRRDRLIATLGVTLAAIALASVATAADPRPRRGFQADQGLYETSRLLEYQGNECARVPGCVTVQAPPALVRADQVKVVAVQCPDTHPVAWHWDTEQHEHMLVRLVGRTRQGLSFSIRNVADAAGTARIFVGCSTAPFSFAGTGAQTSRIGVPTRQQPVE
jgi:hypothetical protein